MMNKTKDNLTRIQSERRDEILEAALEIFSKNGYRGASINKIADAANMSTPRLLYHFNGKEKLYSELLTSALSLWIEPLERIGDTDDAVEEICAYVRRKLQISKDYPRESRLFASEILVGIERAEDSIFEPLHEVFNAKMALLNEWSATGKLASVDPYHLIYTIWATTQHYADFDAQIRMLSPDKMDVLFEEAEAFLIPMYSKMLTP